ncbi:MAG: MarR family winged helix-turn-helix transcriptional regulator [Burkholderiaceae bacterium]
MASTSRVVRIDPSQADLDHLLSYRLSVVSNLLSRSLLKRLESAAEITLPEWRVLVLVNTYGPLSVKALSRHAGLDFGQASRLVSRMCESDLIVKKPTDDARSVDLQLTAQGRALHRKLWTIAMRSNDQFLASLNQAERKLLYGALDTLAAAARVPADEPRAKRGGAAAAAGAGARRA